LFDLLISLLDGLAQQRVLDTKVRDLVGQRFIAGGRQR